MKKVLLTAAVMMVFGVSYAQDGGNRDDITGEDIVIDYELPMSADNTVTATNEIRLKPGFRARHPGNFKTSLKIDDFGVHPPEAGLTGGPVAGDGGVVGAIGGTADVSTLGGATYTIPIEVPAGVNGMNPALAISYNSQSGSGLLGYGWDLTGISSITRTGSTLYHDGKMTAADFSQDDRFLLDGQRLIMVGEDGNSVEYKTEQDEFSRIVFYRDGGEFSRCVVWQADGNIIHYGSDGNARLTTADGRHVIKWMASRVEDRNGNAMEYSYNNDPQNGEIYISGIDYTINEKAKINAEFKVEFGYADRKNPYSGFTGGYEVKHTKILENIVVKRNGKDLQTYSLAYEQNNTWHDILSRISLEKDGVKVNPTTVRWNVPAHGDIFDALSESEMDTAMLNKMTFQGDFNGDGCTDLLTVPYKPHHAGYASSPEMKVFLNDQTGGFPVMQRFPMFLPDSLEWIHVADLNGDGHDDIVVHEEMMAADGNDVSVRTVVTIYETRFDGGTITFNEMRSLEADHRLLLRFGDFLGIRQTSMLAIPVGTAANLFPSELFTVVYHDDTASGYAIKDFDTGDSMFYFYENIALADDFNGDGKTELVFITADDGGVLLTFDNTSGTLDVTPGIISHDEAGEIMSVYSGDFNGDGMADLMYNTISVYKNKVFVMLANGAGFENAMLLTNSCFDRMALPHMGLYSYSLDEVSGDMSCGISVTDIDGDGRTDVLWYNDTDNKTVFLRDFNPDSRKFECVCSKDKWTIRFLNRYFTVGNFLGRDNLSMVGTKYTHEDKAFVYSLGAIPGFFTVNEVRDGMGNAVSIEYGCLMPGGKSIYRHLDKPARYDVRPVPLPVLAVKTLTTSGGVPVRREYGYSNIMLHRTGRGLLGFENVTVMTYVGGLRTELSSNRYELETMQDNAVLLPECDTTYVFAGGRRTVSLAREYHFARIVNRHAGTGGKHLIMHPAMSSYTAKAFNVDKPGTLLSKTMEEYTYNDTDLMYDDCYGCTNTITGMDTGNCGSAVSCEYVTQKKNTFAGDDYTGWIINRKSRERISTCLKGQGMVTRITRYEYAPDNPYLYSRVTSSPSGNERDPLTVSTDYAYYATGNVERVTTSAPYGKHGERPVTVAYTYDAGGRNLITKTTDPDGLCYTESYGYDTRDRLTTSTDANGLVTTHRHDNAFGSTVTTTSPTGKMSVRAVRWAGDNGMAPPGSLYCRWEKTSGEAEAVTFFDADGNVLRSVTYNHKQDPVAVDMEYDSRGLLSRQSNPHTGGGAVWTTIDYDELGRPVMTRAPDGTVTRVSYSGRHTSTAVETPDGRIHKTSKVVNQLGWTVESTDAGGATVKYQHYSDGRLKSAVTSGGEVRLDIEYDHAGNRTVLSDPDYGKTTSVSDAFGRLMEQTTPKGCRTEYSYDVFGRMTRKVEDAGGTPVTCSYIYNETDGLKGTLHSVVHDNETVWYDYDGFLRPTSTAQSIGGRTFTTTLQYDRLSRVVGKTYPSGYSVSYDYYRNGLKHSVKDSGGNVLWRTDDVDELGQILNAHTGNGAVTDNEYDPLTHELLKSIVRDKSKNIQDFSYSYDKFGNLAARKDNINNVEETFTYDDTDRLTGVTLRSTAQSRPVHSEMRYDGYGRMTRKQMDGRDVFGGALFNASKPHAMESATAAQPLLARVGQSIEYTPSDKVSRIEHDGMSVSYTYGTGNRRVSMAENTGHDIRTKIYAGGCEFITEDGREKVLTYLTGPCGVFAVVVSDDSGETIHYIHKDNLGSWTTVTDAKGSVEQRQSFDAWGNRRNARTWHGSADDIPLFDRGYTGHEHLYAFGLINMNGRMYDPLTSSFLSPDNYVQDPTSQQGFNRYAYCFYNPLKYTDPAGERAYGPAWYEIMKAEEEYVKQERYNAYMCGMNNLGYHDTFEMMFFNSICTWGDNGPANTGGGHDTTHSGIGKTKDKDGNMIPDENKSVPDGGKTTQTGNGQSNTQTTSTDKNSSVDALKLATGIFGMEIGIIGGLVDLANASRYFTPSVITGFVLGAVNVGIDIAAYNNGEISGDELSMRMALTVVECVVPTVAAACIGTLGAPVVGAIILGAGIVSGLDAAGVFDKFVYSKH